MAEQTSCTVFEQARVREDDNEAKFAALLELCSLLDRRGSGLISRGSCAALLRRFGFSDSLIEEVLPARGAPSQEVDYSSVLQHLEARLKAQAQAPAGRRETLDSEDMSPEASAHVALLFDMVNPFELSESRPSLPGGAADLGMPGESSWSPALLVPRPSDASTRTTSSEFWQDTSAPRAQSRASGLTLELSSMRRRLRSEAALIAEEDELLATVAEDMGLQRSEKVVDAELLAGIRRSPAPAG